mmetsp:Transcript_55780/g.167158  ORF Transcript_55780/g.167158 Transcript_55780/m.167158 type:complete len:137 (+) Transcript_55780:548-958(+)
MRQSGRHPSFVKRETIFYSPVVRTCKPGIKVVEGLGVLVLVFGFDRIMPHRKDYDKQEWTHAEKYDDLLPVFEAPAGGEEIVWVGISISSKSMPASYSSSVITTTSSVAFLASAAGGAVFRRFEALLWMYSPRSFI